MVPTMLWYLRALGAPAELVSESLKLRSFPSMETHTGTFLRAAIGAHSLP